MIGKNVSSQQNENKDSLSLTDEFLDRCMDGTQFHLQLEATDLDEDLILLDRVGDRVRAFRMELGESRDEFSRSAGVNNLDIFSIENSLLPLESVISILSRVDNVKYPRFVPMIKSLLHSKEGSTRDM